MSPEIREAQRLTVQTTQNTAMAVTLDVGHPSDIHPQDKQPVGARLALAEKGYDPDFGARPLKRLIQKTIADAAALLILEGKVAEGGSIVVDAVDGEFTVRAQDLVSS